MNILSSQEKRALAADEVDDAAVGVKGDVGDLEANEDGDAKRSVGQVHEEDEV